VVVKKLEISLDIERRKVMITNTAKQVLEMREALATAEQNLAKAEASFKLELAKQGVDYAVVDGTKVAVVKGERPTYSVEALKDLVSDKVFKTVTKFAVDGKKFKSAVEVGVIKADVADAVTTITAYEQIRVTELKGAKSESKANAEKQVA
jgi:uncharacterized cupredoxin-like copper-binding protein